MFEKHCYKDTWGQNDIIHNVTVRTDIQQQCAESLQSTKPGLIASVSTLGINACQNTSPH